MAENGTICGENRPYEQNGNMTTVSNEINKKAGKSANTFSGTQTSRKRVAVEKNSFKTAHFVARNGNNASSRACYGFENEGIVGGILYLDNDGQLKFLDNIGNAHTLSWQ